MVWREEVRGGSETHPRFEWRVGRKDRTSSFIKEVVGFRESKRFTDS